MILISFIHIIKRNVRESCYKKYRVYLYIGNIGITIFTTARLSKNLQGFPHAV